MSHAEQELNDDKVEPVSHKRTVTIDIAYQIEWDEADPEE